MAEIWGAAIMVGGSLIAGYAASKGKKEDAQTQNKYSKEDQELNFQRQAWLAQQQRAWQLQDRKYKQDAIAGFAQFGKPSGITPPNQNAELAGLNQFDPNKLGSIGGPQQQQPQPNSPLSQFSGVGSGR